jgi:acyl-CoA hydrolase
VPGALGDRITAARKDGHPFSLWTGAATTPEFDGALAVVDGIELLLPYQADPVSRNKINSGHMDYIDVRCRTWRGWSVEGFLGPLDLAVVEASESRSSSRVTVIFIAISASMTATGYLHRVDQVSCSAITANAARGVPSRETADCPFGAAWTATPSGQDRRHNGGSGAPLARPVGRGGYVR